MTAVVDLLREGVEAGGPIVVILGGLSVYALALVILKAVQLAGVLGGRRAREAAIVSWGRGERETAERALSEGRTPMDRVVLAAMRGRAAGLDRVALTAEVERLGNAELDRLGRNLRMLEVIAMVSPLLGLLGTVLGMIQSFQELELAGGSANAAVLAGGIWQALLTTAAGLSVAIPAAIAANLMAARVDRVGHAIEHDAGRILAAVPVHPAG
ncbi:MotA/TolQ/ExbB proton channel family protein [Roseospira goensis]|uniref:Biopolymer transport protein ExbB n=1 Tax=Roseospira goensis TaxID=391922 RepID=A0A7W6WJN0_9PROT|nr:MotA/TolQ/ExbB proton channel family protein [Roseospira goensis]MBB4284849.1 biopolymer transport protein ExbB [Roseospira goensis]